MAAVRSSTRPASGETPAPAGVGGARRRRLGLPLWIIRIGLIVVGLSLVEVGVRTEIIDPFFVPRPSDVLVRMGVRLTEARFLELVAITLGETLAGFALAASVGVTVGFLLWRFQLLGDAYEPLVAALFSSPIVLLYPIFLVIFGRTPAAIIALSALFAVLPTILYTRQALSAVSRTLLNVGRSFNLTGWANFRHIMLPAAAPTVFTGLRLALTYVLIVTVATEFILQIGGLGKFVSESALRFQAIDLYVSVGLIIVISSAFIWSINQLEKVVRR